MFDFSQHPQLWRAHSLGSPVSTVVPTGFVPLDDALGAGWPTPALIEILNDVHGIGEIQLIVPLLKQLVADSGQPALVAWVNPPHHPNAVALAQMGLMTAQHWTAMNLSADDTLWCAEKALRAECCAAVIAWAHAPKMSSLRRLKLLVAQSKTTAILYRPSAESLQPSPAHVRLRLAPVNSGLNVSVLKVRGRDNSDVLLDVEAHQLQRAES